MDYTYIKENIGIKPNNEDEFINMFKKMCKAFDVDLKDDNGNYKNMSNLFKRITKTIICYCNDLGED